MILPLSSKSTICMLYGSTLALGCGFCKYKLTVYCRDELYCQRSIPIMNGIRPVGHLPLAVLVRSIQCSRLRRWCGRSGSNWRRRDISGSLYRGGSWTRSTHAIGYTGPNAARHCCRQEHDADEQGQGTDPASTSIAAHCLLVP